MHEKIALAVDYLLFTIKNNRLMLLLVERKEEPFKGVLAIPGVAVAENEGLYDAAKRCLYEKTGITDDIYTEQLYTWGDDINRDPRNRVVSVSYYSLVSFDKIKSEMLENAKFYYVDEILDGKYSLAFDHYEIIKYSRERLKGKAEYTHIAFYLVEDEFTLPELQKVYEILLGKELFKANFRASVKDKVEETGNMRRDGAYRPSKLYRRKD